MGEVRRVVILGSTGSIGTSALDVIRKNRRKFEVVALTAGTNVDLLAQQVHEFQPDYIVVKSDHEADKIKALLNGLNYTPRLLFGEDGYCEVASLPDVDVVLSAIVGAAGLLPTIRAVENGKVIALANKEAMVIAGSIIVPEAEKRGAVILPVDSEHNAIFQSLRGHNRLHLKRILLTASGGPFLHMHKKDIARVTPSAALKHPNWSMGNKITIDSATLMNKGLELIEAKWLFSVPVDKIQVVIHPESIVHSMVEYIDGSVIAEMAIPDMRIPIAYALAYPERLELQLPELDLFKIKSLNFFPPDEDKFPCLRLAKEACKIGGTMPAVLNAANEVAVHAFLKGQIGFYDIPDIIEKVMEAHEVCPVTDIQQVLDVDRWARREAETELLKRGQR